MSRQMFSALLAIGCAALPGAALAADSAERVFRDLTPAVVEIATLESWGSGVLVDRDGLVLTNRHVDSMGSPSAVRAGMDCHAIGTPTGTRVGTATTHSITSGIVSAASVDLPGGPFVQTTTPVNPGNSGGPLCDADGNVIGVITARLEGADSIAFAIPWAAIRRAGFKEPEPVTGPGFDELELRAREAARLAAGESGRNRLAYLRDELQARRAQLAFATSVFRISRTPSSGNNRVRHRDPARETPAPAARRSTAFLPRLPAREPPSRGARPPGALAADHQSATPPPRQSIR